VGDVDRRPFWLGLSGGVIGILVTFWNFLPLIPLVQSDTNAGTVISGFYLFSLIFPIIGMVSGVTGKNKNAGILMICCGVIELFLLFFSVGILTGIFFIIGGFILYRNANEKAKTEEY
jgi:hypothetical protein